MSVILKNEFEEVLQPLGNNAAELEAIRLTEEIGADIVILDDLRARQKDKLLQELKE